MTLIPTSVFKFKFCKSFFSYINPQVLIPLALLSHLEPRLIFLLLIILSHIHFLVLLVLLSHLELIFATHLYLFYLNTKNWRVYFIVQQNYIRNEELGVITIKSANNDKGLKDYSPFYGHFHFFIERTFGMKSCIIWYYIYIYFNASHFFVLTFHE